MRDRTVRIGMKVMGSDGEAGTIEDVLSDEKGTPRYVVVRDRGVFGSDRVLQAADAELGEGEVRYAMTRAQIHAAETYDETKYGAGSGLVSDAASSYDQQERDA